MGPNKAFLTLAQDGGDSFPRLYRKVQPMAWGPMVEPASPFGLHATQCISDLPNREGRVPVGVLELDRFLPWLA